MAHRLKHVVVPRFPIVADEARIVPFSTINAFETLAETVAAN